MPPPPTTRAPTAAIAARTVKQSERTDAFADHLANGLSVEMAGAELGMSRGASQGMMARIRARLEWQAR
jgi:hypothetical protein